MRSRPPNAIDMSKVPGVSMLDRQLAATGDAQAATRAAASAASPAHRPRRRHGPPCERCAQGAASTARFVGAMVALPHEARLACAPAAALYQDTSFTSR